MALTPEQEQHLGALLERSGVRGELIREAEEKRGTEEAELRAELAKNEARLAARMPKLIAAREAAEARDATSRREAQAALEDYAKAASALSTLHDEYWTLRHRIEPQLRGVADPRIAQLAAQLRAKAKDPQRSDLEHEEHSRRVRATIELAEDGRRVLEGSAETEGHAGTPVVPSRRNCRWGKTYGLPRSH